MKKINDLTGLLTQQLKEAYSTKIFQLESLSKFINKAETPALKKLFVKGLTSAKAQKVRMEEVFTLLEKTPKSNNPKVINELVNNGLKIAKKSKSIEVLEA